jgi:hypothetical protein
MRVFNRFFRKTFFLAALVCISTAWSVGVDLKLNPEQLAVLKAGLKGIAAPLEIIVNKGVDLRHTVVVDQKTHNSLTAIAQKIATAVERFNTSIHQLPIIAVGLAGTWWGLALLKKSLEQLLSEDADNMQTADQTTMIKRAARPIFGFIIALAGLLTIGKSKQIIAVIA